MNEISKQYNELLDAGVSITELYVYHLIVNDERSFGMSEKEIVDMIVSSLGNYASSYIGIISIIYLPFNFFKGLMVCAAYEAIFNTLIFLVIRNNPKLGKYFKNTKKEKIEEVKKVEENN